MEQQSVSANQLQKAAGLANQANLDVSHSVAGFQSAPWLDQMRKYIGQRCPTGQIPTPFIEECFKHTNYGPLRTTPPACAASLNRCLEEVGFQGTHSAAAASFLHYGNPVSLTKGAILVFEWPNGEHHVTICDEVIDAQNVRCLGGNQNHLVKDSVYPRASIAAIRWPVK